MNISARIRKLERAAAPKMEGHEFLRVKLDGSVEYKGAVYASLKDVPPEPSGITRNIIQRVIIDPPEVRP